MPVLERDASLATLRSAFDRASAGTGSMVLVSGEAGVGKTTLVHSFAEALTGDVRVLEGACDDLIAPPAFGPWYDIARTSGGSLADALSGDAEPGAVLRAVVEVASASLNLIVIEDVHWADDATLDSLRYLSRRIADLPSVVAVTYRTDELSAGHPLLGVLGQLHGSEVHRISLDPLTAAGVAELAAGSDFDPIELHRITGGNPFFVQEVLATSDGGVPPTVRDAVLARLAPLPQPTRDVISTVAVAPGGLEQDLVVDLFRATPDALSAAEGHGILEVADDRFRFHNELARRVVEEALTSVELRTANQRVLDGLQAVGADEARILHHAVAAGDVETLMSYAPDEARRCAASGAHRQAAAWLEMVLDHEDRLEPEDRAQILYDYAVELHQNHRLEEAAHAAAGAVAAWEDREDATALGRANIELARNQYFLGNVDEARASAERAVDVLERGGSDEALAAAYSSLAALHVWRHHMGEALPWGDKARRLAAAIDRQDILSHALNYQGVAKVLTGDQSGFDDLTEAVSIARSIGHAEYAARGANNLATALFSNLRYAEGVAVLEAGIDVAADAELLSLEHNMRGLLGQGLLMLGRWDDAEAELRPLVARADGDLLAAPSFGYLGRLLMRRGIAEGDELIDRGLSIPGVNESLLRYGALAAAAVERAWLDGDAMTVERFRTEVVSLAESVNSQDWTGTVILYAARSGLEATPPDPCPPSFKFGIEGDWEQAAAAWAEVGEPYEQAIELVLSGRADPGLDGLRNLERLGAIRTVDWARGHLEGAGVDVPEPAE